MTSRRKQNKPIKASCQSLDACSMKIDSIPMKIELEFLDSLPKPCLENSIFPVKETTHFNIESVMKSEENSVDLQNHCVKKEENSEMAINFNPTDDSLDEISKKINKDEAKILPFQSSGGVEFFKCPLCNESYICGRENLTTHLQEHQNKMKRDDGKHLCCLCSKELSSNSSLERHLLTHSNHRPFSCYMCDKKFTTNGNLSRHIKTSHNNNETIESSIDEVLKKHQSESCKISQDILPEIKIVKYRKSLKSSKKELGSMDTHSSEKKVKDQTFVQPCLGIVDPSISEPLFKTILPANMNFLPSLLSLNINDFSFLQPNHSGKPNFLQHNTISFLANIPNKVPGPNFHQTDLKNKFTHLKSMSPNRQKKTKQFLRKIELHLNRLRKVKKRSWDSNIRCRKCCKIFLQVNNVISHIRKCYSKNSTAPICCMFRVCNRKFQSKKRLIKHVKEMHICSDINESLRVSPNMEPLNLSMKSSKLTESFDSSLEVVNKQNTNSYRFDNVEFNYINPNLFQGSLTDSHEKIIDFSATSNSQWNSMKPITSQIPQNNIPLNCFSSSNQFISSSPFFTISPISSSNSIKSDWPPLNKIEFSDCTTINLEPISPKSDILTQISDLSLKTGINVNSLPISCNGIESLSTKSSTTDFSSSSPLTETGKLKYCIGFKKKNSYKDAPKLITCPMEGCVQKFPWNSSLMRHILTHTAHKPFKCTRCTKCFSTKSNRERHMTRVHGVRINRSKFKSLQAAKANLEDLSKVIDETVDSENGNFIDEIVLSNEREMNITELSEEEWIIMDNNDRRAEDISNNLLKLAGQPLVEPNPVRLNNNQIPLDKSISPKSEYSSKPFPSISKDRFYLDNIF